MKFLTRFFAVVFVLLTTQTIDAREPWPPKDLGKDLPKDLSAAYWHASDIAPKKFPYPDEVETLFYDLNVRSKFSFMVGRMMEIAKRGNGRMLREDEAKLKAALDGFLVAIFSNRRFAGLPALKQRVVAKAMGNFTTAEIAARVIWIHTLADIEWLAKQKKKRSR